MTFISFAKTAAAPSVSDGILDAQDLAAAASIEADVERIMRIEDSRWASIIQEVEGTFGIRIPGRFFRRDLSAIRTYPELERKYDAALLASWQDSWSLDPVYDYEDTEDRAWVEAQGSARPKCGPECRICHPKSWQEIERENQDRIRQQVLDSILESLK